MQIVSEQNFQGSALYSFFQSQFQIVFRKLETRVVLTKPLNKIKKQVIKITSVMKKDLRILYKIFLGSH